MGLRKITGETDHRPWPLPSGPWVMTQWWRDLLFAHWPVPPSMLRPIIPASLELDTFDNQAWVAVVPFRMTGVRPRLTPALPWISHFAELNVRTYVRYKSKPGVYFWSLEASNPVAVAAARTLFHLPYMNATMSCRERNEWIDYTSIRTHRNEPPAEFSASYRPLGLTSKTELIRWLTERYCLYTTDNQERLYRGEIHHEAWPLYEAEAQIEINSMARAAGIELPNTPPLLHFAKAIQVAIWPLSRL
ncbi:MAG: DUF2071 domain-containing protein [Acidobacteria bacterium]|nr:DUF2071 domain-containing protein [Acidobacteriota bacterium]